MRASARAACAASAPASSRAVASTGGPLVRPRNVLGMAKGTYGWILLATKDLDGTFERVQASDAEVVQEPTEQPYGVRECAFRDPAGNLIRIQELR